MSIYEQLAKTPQFQTLVGLSPDDFDELVKMVEKKHPKLENKRLSRDNRQRAIGAGRKFALDLRDRVLLLLVYYRTYVSQRLAAFIFRVSQPAVCRTIKQIMPAVKACIPLPAKIHNKTKRVSDMKELESLIPELCILVDAAEQQIQRPKRKDMEKSHYSGKAKRHTVKVQYTTNIHGDIIHKTRHSPGKIHDSTVFNKKHPKLRNTMPNGIPIQFTGYADRGYQGANDVLGSLMMITPIKKKRGKNGEKSKKLTPVQKEYNRILSKIRIYVEHAIRRVKRWRIMGNTYRNPLKNYDSINNVVCGLVNYQLQRLAMKTT